MRKLFLVFLLAMACSLPTYATITATIGTVTAVSGQTATIPITLSGANGAEAFWGCELKFNYDNTKVSVAGGSITNYSTALPAGNWVQNINYNPTTIYNSYAETSFNNVDVPNNTVIFNILVTYTGTVSTPITWDGNGSYFINVGAAPQAVNWIHGAINPAGTSPAAPSLSLPVNSALNISINPTLSWNTIANATSYEYQYSTNASFTQNLISGNAVNNSISINSLLNGTQYYWRVRTNQGTLQSAWSNVFSFTTTSAQLAVPVLSTPTNNDTGVSINPTLSWNSVATATLYEYQYSTSIDFLSNSVSGSTANLSIAINTLQNNTTYFWRVRAISGTIQSAWSSVFNFTTIFGQLAVPVISAPANNATNVSINPTLSWSMVTNALSYDCECSTNSNFIGGLVSGSSTNLPNPSLSIGPLQNGTVYYWRVRANRGTDHSAWSNTYAFITVQAPIAVPVLLSPINNETNVAVNPTLSWNAVATATSYDYEYSTSSNFSVNPVSGNTTNIAVVTNTLPYSTTYFWRVRANRGAEQSVWSNVFSFTTSQAPIAAPIQFFPANNVSNIVLSPTLSWNPVATATAYYLEVSSISDFSTTIYAGNVSGTSKSIAGLTNFTKYFWRVKSIRNAETSGFSATWNFTTFLQAPTLISPVNGYSSVAIHPTLNWSSVPMATSYLLQVSKSSNFDVLQTNEIISANSKMLTSLEYNTVYYWRVSAASGSASSGWSSVFSFTSMSLPAEWNVQASTGSSATIGFKNPLQYRIGQRAFDNGDAIGVFYTVGSQQVCGGILIWDGLTFGLVAWGDDLLSTTSKEGFAINEEYSFKVWDAFEQKTYPAQLTIDSGETYFANNGISIYKAINVSLDYTQIISLDAGWNMISGFIDPNNHNMASIASSINGSLSQIRNITGLTYRPPFTNTLSTWDKTQAYQVKMNTAGSLVLTGAPIVPETETLTLAANYWHWIPYYRNSSLAIGQALSSISGKYQQVKNMTGKVYWAPYITTLSQFVPGNGYMIKIHQNAILTYPANSAIKASATSAESNFQSPKVFKRTDQATGKTSVIGLELANAEDGDEVAAFTKDGMLVGSAVWSDGSHGLVVWGDDETTIAKDGANEGEELVIKVWKNASKSIETINALSINDQSTGNEQYALTYETDAIAVVSGIIENAEVSSIRVSPQPASSEAFITIANSSFNKVNLSIYNQAGSLVQTLSDNLQNGMIRINTNELSSGVYSVIANIEGKIYNQRIIIAR